MNAAEEKTAPVDPNVRVPAAVTAAAARADELHQQYLEANRPPEEVTPRVTPEAGEEGPEPDSPRKAAKDKKADAPQAPRDGVRAETVKPPAQTEAAREKTAEQPLRTEAVEQTEAYRQLDHKYRSLHGRLTRADGENRELAGRVQQLEQMLAKLGTGSTAGETASADQSFALTPEELNDYGEDFLTVVGKKARAEIAAARAADQQRIQELETRLASFEGHVTQSRQEGFLAAMDRAAPRWRELNTDQRFLEWLGLSDAYSGAIRHDMLSAAYKQADVQRVAAFFNGFLAEEAAVAPARGEPDPAPKRAPRVTLEELAAPGRAKAAAASNDAPTEKPIITRAHIARFYADVASGVYRGRDADKATREAEIFAAQAEGRIR